MKWIPYCHLSDYHEWSNRSVYSDGIVVGSSVILDHDAGTRVATSYHGIFVESYISYWISGNDCCVYVGWTYSWGQSGTTAEWYQVADKLSTRVNMRIIIN